MSTLTLVVIRCLLLSTLAFGYATVKRASVCNGHAELCSRSFGNVSFVGAHDSFAVGPTNLAANQDYNGALITLTADPLNLSPVTQQLTDGIRMLQNQAHITDSGEIHLCHTSCLLYDGGSLKNYLTSVKTWMDANINEVVSILIVNIDNLAASAYGQVFQSTGLSDLAFTPNASVLHASQWPTLGEMIDSGKRLVVFLDNGANDTAFPYLIPEFVNIWETAFDVTDPSFSCAVNRTQGDTTQQMYLINHFLESSQQTAGNFSTLAPAKDQLNVTNAVSGPGSLGQQARDCIAQNGRAPNFMLVDFYEYGQGSVFQVAADLNGVPIPSNTIAPVPGGSAPSSQSPGSAQSLISPQGAVATIIALTISLLTGYLSLF